jgi:hypothetical protein
LQILSKSAVPFVQVCFVKDLTQFLVFYSTHSTQLQLQGVCKWLHPNIWLWWRYCQSKNSKIFASVFIHAPLQALNWIGTYQQCNSHIFAIFEFERKIPTMMCHLLQVLRWI